ncbi:MAG: hypothetical protein K8R48_00330 [Alphaproteobacteria bacterium]|nr:hypothetical protein [Alphaproteobacteria bacterium]
MIYTLNDLLVKMGAPEAGEKGRMCWHYFDKVAQEIAGFAEIRLIDGGHCLIAELQRLRHNYEDDAGTVHPAYTESFYLHAEKTGDRYKVTKVAFDGEEYSQPQKSIIELGLSIFHARALEISILMVEQTFNKQDILNPVIDEYPHFKGVPVHVKNVLKKETWGTVIPFRPRAELRV